MAEAILYEKLDKKQVRCTCCYQRCIIEPKKTGICGVRRNRDGKLYLEIYGYAIAKHIDPIEKKPLHHFYPTSTAYSVGTIGCNFSCSFCQNWHISMATRGVEDIENISLGQSLPPEEIVRLCLKNNCKTIAYTYNEPTIWTEYAFDTASLAKKKGIKNVYVSNGYMSPEAVELLAPVLDAINIDLKAFTNRFYHDLSGVRLSPVLKNIERFYNLGVWVEVTTLLIPDENDSDEEIRNIAKFIASIDVNIPWHISAFHGAYKMSHKSRTPVSTIKRAYKIGKEEGLNYIFGGNISSDSLTATFCPKCNEKLIERWGYSVEVKGIKNGACKKCGTIIPGIWSDTVQNPLKKRPSKEEAKAIIYGSNIDPKVPNSNFFKNSPFDQDHQILIVFGTQTGKAESYALRLVQIMKQNKETEESFDIKVADLADCAPELLASQRVVIFITSTYGEGNPPDNAVNLFKYLSSNLPLHTFSSTNYAVYGLGNTVFSGRYQKFARFIDQRMEDLGGLRIIARGERDDSIKDDDFENWAHKLNKQIRLNQGLKIIQQKTKSVSQVVFLDSNNMQVDDNQQWIDINFENSNLPSNKIDYDNPYSALVLENKELLNAGKDQNNARKCRQILLDISKSGIDYQPGDHVGICPINPQEHVEKFARLLHLDLNQQFKVEPPTKRFNKPLKIFDYLSRFCDITGAPDQHILQLLANYAENSGEKTQLERLATNKKEYEEVVLKNKKNIVDFFDQFKSIKITFQFLYENLPRLAPRFYSIASTPKNDPNKLKIIVQVVEKGICSEYLLQTIPNKSQVMIFLKKTTFKYDSSAPTIMIAAGTGLAAFKGMLDYRATLDPKSLKPLYLFFGCRTRDVDFILKDEIEKFASSNVITKTFFAFSREQKEKVYVQHKIKENASLVKEVIANKGKIMVCGNLPMGKDIRLTLIDIFGKKTFDQLLNQNFYLEECW
ncbi:flavodoxin family protein [Anaeramoeba ignava]|uniref:Flavodoxin family protein n=1 Tax=Anaeramoeba ignava TaxID=1746090 RepID=A0A9Q0LBK9_ANAIG|nr:flavodoxin family protein [Anaeramoeba ignava]|eukprot:Anaeramoba_ignava/a478790_160.p1 GENE.a478790_160~~a478790_160.p1  ORF type:complete len:952 (-),score=252.84 a478790_160:68-2923(-)